MFSPRYLAAHLLMPRHLREKGGAAALDAIERKDEWFFVPVWMEAGFRFTPQMVHVVREDFRVGVISLPRPREDTEAFLAAIVGRRSDPAWWRYFLLESGVSVVDGSPITVIGEWAGSTHRNFGSGPPFTGNAEDDITSFVERVLEICRPA